MNHVSEKMFEWCLTFDAVYKILHETPPSIKYELQVFILLIVKGENR